MKRLQVAVALIEREGRWFLQRRAMSSGRFPGLWELPGGKVEAGESSAEALRRELREELGWAPGALRPLHPLLHAYGDFEVLLEPFACSCGFRLETDLAWGWFRREEALRLPQPEATRALLEGLFLPG